MAIGKRIKFFRNRKGMTQKQLGEHLGLSQEKPLMSVWHNMNLKPENPKSILSKKWLRSLTSTPCNSSRY